jgi:hypothetical protein
VVRLPARPMAHLLGGPARCALAALSTVLAALCGLGHTGARPPRGRGRRVGQGRIDRHHRLVVAVASAPDHHQLLVAVLPSVRARPHTSFDHLDHQGAVRAIADLHPLPGVLAERRAPRLHALPRTLWPAPPAAGHGGRRLQLPPPRRRGPRQPRPCAPPRQATPAPIRTPPLSVTRHPRRRQHGAMLLSPVPRQLVTGAVAAGGLGPPRLVPPRLLRGPVLGEIPPQGNQGGAWGRDVTQGDGPLPVVDLSHTAAPRPRHAHGRATRWGNAAGSHPNTPSLCPTGWPTWSSHVWRKGASAQSAQPMQPCSPRRFCPTGSAMEATFVRATADRRPLPEVWACGVRACPGKVSTQGASKVDNRGRTWSKRSGAT